MARRWQSRPDLAVAAIGHYNKNNPIDVPDLGNVRAELIILLQKLSERGTRTMAKVLFTMNDYFVETNSSIVDLQKKLADGSKLQEVLQRGVARGELDQSKMTPRIEIIDTIFLPLAAAKAEG